MQDLQIWGKLSFRDGVGWSFLIGLAPSSGAGNRDFVNWMSRDQHFSCEGLWSSSV